MTLEMVQRKRIERFVQKPKDHDQNSIIIIFGLARFNIKDTKLFSLICIFVDIIYLIYTSFIYYIFESLRLFGVYRFFIMSCVD